VKSRCPVVARGVHLRGLCVDCGGEPSADIVLERGAVLYHQGAAANRVFALIDGWLRVHVMTPDGRSCGARLAGPGSVLGLEAFGVGAPSYLATCDAIRRARACAVPIMQARAWFQLNPDEALALTALGAEDLAELQRRLVHNASLSAEERVLELVKDLIGSAPPGTWMTLPATREQLGEVLGLTLETVSRMLHRLSARGIIELEGRRVRLR